MTERLAARQVVALMTDGSSFTEIPYPERQSAPDGPLAWDGYDASRARAVERTGEHESVVCGTGTIEGTRAVLIAFEFGFLGGSLGERTGDRLEAAYGHARTHRLPVVPLVATGGSRMQEGMLPSPNSSAWPASRRSPGRPGSRRSRCSGIRRPAAAGPPSARAPT